MYNRPEELDELLASILIQEYDEVFDVYIIEDGSSVKSDLIVEKYKSELSIHYLEKENTGPGPRFLLGPADFLTGLNKCSAHIMISN